MPILKTCKGHCRSSLWLLTLFLIAGPGFAQDRQTLGWVEAINQALQANQSLASAQENLKAQREDVTIARAGFMPQLNLAGGFTESRSDYRDSWGSPTTTGSVGASLNQMIYDEKTFANHGIQKYLFASQEEQLKNTRFGIIVNAGQAYIQTLLAEDLLQVQIANRGLTEQNLEISKYREEVGATSLQEVLRWQSQLYSNEQDIAGQGSNALASRFALNQVRNRPAEESYALEKLTIEKNGFIFSSDIVARALSNPVKASRVRDFLVERALADYPLIASLDREIAAQKRQLSSNRRWLIPSFSFNAGADAYYRGDGDNPNPEESDWSVGISMNMPLFNGGANYAEVHQASAQLRSLNAQRNELVSSQEQVVRSQAARTIADFQSLVFAIAQVEAAEENYSLVYDGYLVGENSLLDILDAQNERLMANSSKTIALYTFMADLLGLEQSMGYFPFLEPQNQVDSIVQELERRLQMP